MCMVVLGIAIQTTTAASGGSQGHALTLEAVPTTSATQARALKSRDDLHVITVAEDETRHLKFWHAVAPIAIFEYRC